MSHNGQLTRLLAKAKGGSELNPDPERRQAELDRILKRVGARLFSWLRQNPERLPTQDWTETFRYYQSAVIGMLKEDRERQRLTAKQRKGMTPEQLADLAKQELLRALPTFTPEEWALIKQAEAMYDEKRRAKDEPQLS